MLALSIRQPFAELILRGIKTVEYRSRPTRVIGRRFFIYASKKKLPVASYQLPVKAWSEDLRVAGPPAWMIELAGQVGMIEPGALALLPRGVIVGSAVIERVSPVDSMYRWHLADVERADASQAKGPSSARVVQSVLRASVDLPCVTPDNRNPGTLNGPRRSG